MKNRIKAKISSLKRGVQVFHSSHPKLVILLVALSYLLVIFYYMTPQFLNFSSTVYGFGDNTAGPIWRYTVSPNSPFWGFENITNYPYGDNLSSPVYASGSIQYVFYWLLANAFGPIAAYNLLDVVGLFLTALVTYGFVKSLTKRPVIAWLAGYAVTFAPYYQMKIGGHPTYAYQAIFVALIWLFIRLIQYKHRRDAVLLGVTAAASFYFDVYFALFSTLTLFAFGVAWLFLNKNMLIQWIMRRNKLSQGIKLQLKLLLTTVGVMVLILAPLIAFFSINSSRINSEVAAARGNILAEAKACSNWPHEYLTPFVFNPFFRTFIGKERYEKAVDSLKDNFTCGIGEDSVGVSVTLVAVVILGTIIMSWERINGRRLFLQENLHFDVRLLVIGTSLLLLIALAVAFPPLIFHNLIPTPSYALLMVTTTWRTLARAYMLVNIAVVILAIIVMVYFMTNLKTRRTFLGIAFMVIALGVFVEYQAFKPFEGNRLSNFSYQKDVPAAYSWLSQEKSVEVVAEYPIEREGGESDAGSYYLTMQTVHKKKLFNSALSNSKQEDLRDSLKNLRDPQTIPALRAMGVDMVMVHGVEKSALEAAVSETGAKVVYTSPQARFNLLSHTPTVKNDIINALDLRAVSPGKYFINLGKGFTRNTTIINSVIDWQYEAISGSQITGTAIGKYKNTDSIEGDYSTCFDAKMSVPTERTLLRVLKSDGNYAVLGEIDGQSYKRYVYTGNGIQTIETGNGHNFRVTKLGCAHNE